MSSALLSSLVNAYAGALISVSKTVGLDVEFQKAGITSGIKAPGSRVAALIGIVGNGVYGTAALMADVDAFVAYVKVFSGGMIQGNVEDPIALSVLGELSNMISGQALIKIDTPGLDITPPQLITGENLMTVNPRAGEVKSFTLPFKIKEAGSIFLVLSLNA